MTEDSLRSVFREPAKLSRAEKRMARLEAKAAAAEDRRMRKASKAQKTQAVAVQKTDKPTKGAERAAKERARFLSPRRIIFLILSAPVIAGAMAISLYIRTSPHTPQNAMLHLVAMAGCEGAAVVGLAPAAKGRLGYHARNDSDGNGVACEAGDQIAKAEQERLPGGQSGDARVVGGAKFLRP